MASVLSEKGLSGWLGIALLILNLSQLASSAPMITMPHRVLSLPRLLFATMGLVTLALVGFLFLHGPASIYATALIGFATAMQMTVLVMLPPLLRSPAEAGKLAAGMFAIGYALGFVIPLASGAIADVFGSIQGALWLFVAFNLFCLPLAWKTPIQPVGS